MIDKTAVIFDIQRNSYVDGPGIRTTVFFKGCNLRCAWCHNPESQNLFPEPMFYKDRCQHCGICENTTNFVCPNEAKFTCGRVASLAEILRECLKDKLFFDTSGGGVTFSGGECMLQIDFLAELLRQCKAHQLHTAVDTAGNVPYEYFERILPFTDLFLYDVKSMDSQTHKQYTGVGNELPLENLKRLLSQGTRVWVRIPIIPSVNDTVDDMKRIDGFLRQGKMPEKIELLPYHAMGEHKYAALGRESHCFAPPSTEAMEELKKIFSMAE